MFEFASVSKSTVFDKTEWLSFSPVNGKWIYELYEKDAENGKPMRQAVERLFAMSMEERETIYTGIAHDMKFAEDPANGFQFESIGLEKGAQSVISDFFLYFYNVVLCSAHFALQGLTKDKFGRADFAQEYFSGKNKKIKYICPVCLQTTTNAEREDDIEHYFAKAWIPCLALHPYNLYFICPVCNERYKSMKRVFHDGIIDVRRVFLPYIDTIRDRVKIEFIHEEEKDRISLAPADESETYINEKIDSFNQLFDLENRWSGFMEYYFETRSSLYKSLDFSDIDELKEEMRRDLKKAACLAVNRPETYLETKYLEWIYGSQLKAFYSNMVQKDRNTVVI